MVVIEEGGVAPAAPATSPAVDAAALASVTEAARADGVAEAEYRAAVERRIDGAHERISAIEAGVSQADFDALASRVAELGAVAVAQAEVTEALADAVEADASEAPDPAEEAPDPAPDVPKRKRHYA